MRLSCAPSVSGVILMSACTWFGMTTNASIRHPGWSVLIFLACSEQRLPYSDGMNSPSGEMDPKVQLRSCVQKVTKYSPGLA